MLSVGLDGYDTIQFCQVMFHTMPYGDCTRYTKQWCSVRTSPPKVGLPMILTQ